MQHFPASESHHHAYQDSLLDHGLKVVAHALKLRQSHLFPSGATPKAQVAHVAGAAYNALLHDTSKIAFDLHVESMPMAAFAPNLARLSQAPLPLSLPQRARVSIAQRCLRVAVSEHEKYGPVSSKTVTKQIANHQLAEDRKPMSKRSPYIDALKLKDGKWTPHDLRRTGATLMTVLGVLPEVAERCSITLKKIRLSAPISDTHTAEMREAWQLCCFRMSCRRRTIFDRVEPKIPPSQL